MCPKQFFTESRILHAMKWPPFVFISIVSYSRVSSHTISQWGHFLGYRQYVHIVRPIASSEEDVGFAQTLDTRDSRRFTKVFERHTVLQESEVFCLMWLAVSCFTTCRNSSGDAKGTAEQLSSFLASDQAFVFNGSRVCKMFLDTGFQFSNDTQNCAKEHGGANSIDWKWRYAFRVNWSRKKTNSQSKCHTLIARTNSKTCQRQKATQRRNAHVIRKKTRRVF